MTDPATNRASVEEARKFLAAHPEIEAIDLVLIDPNGIGRGKILRRHELLPLFERGRHLPTSILGLDVVGEDVEGTGLVWDVGDADRLAWPIAGTLKPMPWTAPPRGQVLVSMCELDGSPMAADPRHAMLRAIANLKQRGLVPAAAFELEFFLLATDRGADGQIRPAPAALDRRPASGTQVYGLEELDGMQPVFHDVYAAARAQDIPVETLISEYAPGQYELTLHYRNDLARAADDLVMLKRLVRGVARRHGMAACFMAKPLSAAAGSGMHLHVSMANESGSNVYAGEPDSLANDWLRHSIGGLLATLPESMLVFAPHANSWRRLVANSYAPVTPSWGFNNRSVAVRVPAGPSEARRFEHRVAGVDANPYLAAATVLAAVAHGLAAAREPGPSVTGNGYELPVSPAMPADWRSAIAAARGSAFLRDALGATLHRTFTAIKEAEYLRVARAVTELDYRLYLDLI
jgi:glutamine synthetase